MGKTVCSRHEVAFEDECPYCPSRSERAQQILKEAYAGQGLPPVYSEDPCRFTDCWCKSPGILSSMLALGRFAGGIIYAIDSDTGAVGVRVRTRGAP